MRSPYFTTGLVGLLTANSRPLPWASRSTHKRKLLLDSTSEIRSYDLVGGSVTVEIGANTVGLAGASPKAGFSMDVEHSGPERIEVEFHSEHHESEFSGRFEDGSFVPKIEESEHGEDD